jgi:hypothetical protein
MTSRSGAGEPRRAHEDIGHARVGGETKLTVHCLGCYHQAVKTFEELRLWNDMTFVDVPKAARERDAGISRYRD